MSDQHAGVGMSANYQTFLQSKRREFLGDGIGSVGLPPKLYSWQKAMTAWALAKGRSAIFSDCGTGKTFMQVAWADAVSRYGPVLLFAPLCVAEQTIDEAAKLGIAIRYAHDQHEATGPLTITNYERLDRFDPARFVGVVLDESSILKSFDGKTRTALIESWQGAKYRLCCTATPSPNDIAELANHSEFLGLMTRAEFLATWFVHDDEGWRMKRHAVEPFYAWLGSWALSLRSPADLGIAAPGFTLPPLEIRDLIVGQDGPADGVLFSDMGLKGLGGRLKARQVSLAPRCEAVASLVLKSFCDSTQETCLPEEALRELQSRVGQVQGFARTASQGRRLPQWVIWCGLNAEQDTLARLFGDLCVSVSGSDSQDSKRRDVARWLAGDVPILLSKASIVGWGMNFQNCSRMAFVGLNDSYETYYQCIRRSWRYGQTQPVTVTIVVSEAEAGIVANVRRKEQSAISLATHLGPHTRAALLPLLETVA